TTEDEKRSVMTLIPDEFCCSGLFPCGRLDKDTMGLLLITNDGPLGHALLSPRHHVEKAYRFRLEKPLSDEEAGVICDGVEMDGKRTKPARIEKTGEAEGIIYLSEGKYHQVKRMMERVANRVTELERIRFGPLVLDDALPPGGVRPLTDGEIEKLKAAGNAAGNTEES
ncbi:MAG: pseudouridine synthase, partial [Clostridia bacterium]|nr:pseudouridine synthase [Clostridia bacterium]